MKPLYVGYTAPVKRVGREIHLHKGGIIQSCWPTLEEPDHEYPHAAVMFVGDMLDDGHCAMRGPDNQIILYRHQHANMRYLRRGFA